MVQPYFTIGRGKVYVGRGPKKGKAPYAVIDKEGAFVSQVAYAGNFLESSAKDAEANLHFARTTALRVSDDGQIAIEDSTLVKLQPKTFFATDAVLAASQQGMTNSAYRLVKNGRTLKVVTQQGVEKTLKGVYPQPKGGKTPKAYRARMPQNCNNISGMVTSGNNGATTGRMVPNGADELASFAAYAENRREHVSPTQASDVQFQIAELVATLMGGQASNVVGLADIELGEDMHRRRRAIIDRVAVEYANALRGGGQGLNAHLRRLRLNQHAAPDVGEAFVTLSIAAEGANGKVQDLASGRSFTPRWSYHFGGVVAKSGNDVVTLENYARGADGDPVGNASSDPRWYFQMYGLKRGQSFHEAQVASGGFANPITMTLRSPDAVRGIYNNRVAEAQAQARRRAAFNRRVKVGATAVAVGLLAVTVSVMEAWSYTNLRSKLPGWV
ncbi:hypothetical protein [Azospirillum soli]|uniref:hypothetical protein n=1 Tax=Azospirillum soli TaxID=1304799 RepID=UPI001AE13450|nr:hypothetical protein [Azospirillum soli]MBP2316016.1 hypothetical protein [Azospirillum soli]